MSTNPYESPSPTDDDNPQPDGEACPKCGRPMELGYLSSSNYINWATKKPRTGLIYKGEAIVQNFVGMSTVGAVRCQHCELVLFQFGSRKVSTWEKPGT